MNIKFLIIAILFLNSCGFTPIYYNADSDDGSHNYYEKLTLVKIKKYRSNISYKLHDHLTKILNPYNSVNDKEYILDVNLIDQISSTFTTSTGSSGRNKITLIANYKLIDIKNGDILGSGKTSESGDFDVGNKRFANYTTQEETKLHLTKLIAKNIRNMIINDLYQL